MEMLVVICERSITKRIVKTLAKANLEYSVSFYGKGTANSEILSYFGLAETEKEVLVAFAKKDKTAIAIDLIKNFDEVKNHGAVAFSIPVDSIGKSTLDYISK